MEFIENEFTPKAQVLIDLKKRIQDKGLSFHPYLAIQAINLEVENQLRDIITSHFKGMKVEMLGVCSAEIKEYADSEEKRYEEFQRAKSSPLVSSGPSVMSDVETITKKPEPKVVDKTKKKK